jgi:hypothetical protein
VNWNPYPPLPIGAVRDLLGITRALYRFAAEVEPRDEERLRALAEVGKTLRGVLRASRAHPGTIGHGEAWSAAERAARALGGLVNGELGLIVATTARVIVNKRSTMT